MLRNRDEFGRLNAPTRFQGKRRIWLISIALIVPLGLFDWGPIYEWVAYGEPRETMGMMMKYKRVSWFPGAEIRLPEQPCPTCWEGRHDRCSQRTGKVSIPAGFPRGTQHAYENRIESSSFQINGVDVAPSDFTCPCFTPESGH